MKLLFPHVRDLDDVDKNEFRTFVLNLHMKKSIIKSNCQLWIWNIVHYYLIKLYDKCNSMNIRH